MDAWFHSGRSVQLGAAWDPKGYKPAHKAIEARLKVCCAVAVQRYFVHVFVLVCACVCVCWCVCVRVCVCVSVRHR